VTAATGPINWTSDAEPLFTAMTVGERVKWLRDYKGLEQTELTARLGITLAMLSNLITDASRRPDALIVLDMADIFECRPRWILNGRGDPFACVT